MSDKVCKGIRRSKHRVRQHLLSQWRTCVGSLILIAFSVACDDPAKVVITQRDQPLEPLTEAPQTVNFELRASHTDELIATGLTLEPIAQVRSPRVEGDVVQATDVVFVGDKLLASYNFRGEPHRGALQIIDVSEPESPMLSFEMILPRVDLNRIQVYQNRYVVVAAGDAELAASLEIFDLLANAPDAEGAPATLGTPRLIASMDLPSRQATMVTLHQNYALVTTGDDGGVVLVDLEDPAEPELVAYQPLADARYVEVLSDDELLLVSGGRDAAMIRQPWSQLTAGVDRSAIDEASGVTRLSLDGLSVGAPSWGFKVHERFHLSADERGVMTFSLADGGLEETGLVSTEGDANAGALTEEGRLALLANGQEGLVALDVQEGHPTQVLASFDTPGDHGSANAVAVRGELVALADGLGGVKLLRARLLRRQGRIATFLLNFVDAGISGELVEDFIHDAFIYTTPAVSPRVLYVLDDYNNGEHPDDPPLTQSILEMLSYELHIMDEPIDGLSPADVNGYDLIWFANPGWYVEDAATVDTLVSFSAQGGGIVLQGDDMTHRRTGDSLLSELTGLRFINNGTRTCGTRTDNQRGGNYQVSVDESTHPLVSRSAGEVFLYGDDIDHNEPMGIGERVLAWATLQDNPGCDVRVPVIVAWDPKE